MKTNNNNKWTFRPKYTKARIANELADKEQHMMATLTELLRASTKDKDVKTIVFDRFVKMLDDFQHVRNAMDDLGPEDWIVDFNNNTFDWFLEFIQEVLSDGKKLRGPDDPMFDYQAAKEYDELEKWGDA